MKQYWSFYWPLALTGFAMVLSIQFQNGALARYPDAVTELAIFALSQGTFGFFNAAQNFIPQLSNVYCRSPTGRRRCHRFVWGTSSCLVALLLPLALSSPGKWLLGIAYGIEPDVLARVTEYLLYLAPLVPINAQRHFHTGMLVQARLTGWVTTLNAIYLTATIVMLIVGFRLGWRGVVTVVGAQLVAASLHLFLLLIVHRLRYVAPERAEHETLSYKELIEFFIPVTTTGLMFALSRPVLYGFVARTEDALLSIAALRVAFDFSMLFQQAANQFRHFFVTFGLDDLAGKRRFMAVVCAGITLIMLATAATPLSEWVLGEALGIGDAVKQRSVESILVLCLLPVAIITRNYFHGLLMVYRRTAGMAWGGILRVIGIYLCAQALYLAGHLDHITASAVLVLGFVIETAVVVQATVRVRRSM